MKCYSKVSMWVFNKIQNKRIIQMWHEVDTAAPLTLPEWVEALDAQGYDFVLVTPLNVYPKR